MKKFFVIFLLISLILANTTNQNYQEIIQGFKELEKSSKKGLNVPLFSPRKLSKIKKNKNFKGSAKRKRHLGDIPNHPLNFIPNTLFGKFTTEADRDASLAGQGILGAALGHKFYLENHLKNLIQAVEYKIKVRNIMLHTIEKHSSDIAIISSEVERFGKSVEYKEESFKNFIDGIILRRN